MCGEICVETPMDELREQVRDSGQCCVLRALNLNLSVSFRLDVALRIATTLPGMCHVRGRTEGSLHSARHCAATLMAWHVCAVCAWSRCSM